MAKYSIFITCLLLSACMTPEQLAMQQAAQEQADVDTCIRYGLKPGSELFANCRLQLDLARQERYNRAYYYHPHPHFSYHHWR